MRKKKERSARLSKEMRQPIVDAYLCGKKPKVQIWRELTGRSGGEHGQILRWMRQLGYVAKPIAKKPIALLSMAKKKTKKDTSSTQAMQDKIRQLENKLQDSQLQAEAYRRMIQIAEDELKIDIQKKSTTR